MKRSRIMQSLLFAGVTPKKVLGANYGFMVALPFSTVRPEHTILESFEPDWGLNDLYFRAAHS